MGMGMGIGIGAAAGGCGAEYRDGLGLRRTSVVSVKELRRDR